MKAKISEIFYSIQGEGIYQGIPQVFIRFWGCNLHCYFCDTNISTCNEMSIADVIGEIFSINKFWDSLALTGGAADRLLQLVPATCMPRIDLTLTDDHPYAQAIVIISAIPAKEDPR